MPAVISRGLELVIFDCDGVLVDSEPISNTVLAEKLSHAGLATSPAEALLEYKGRLLADVVARAEASLGRALPAGFVEAYETARIEAFRRGLEGVPGAAEAVRAVSMAGVDVCVASQGKLEKTELTLSLTGLRTLFGTNALFSAYSVARGKPHPDLFLHAAQSMGVAPRRSVVVEDTSIGVRAGVAAGMRVLGYAAASNADAPPDADARADQAALREAGAEVIGSMAELPQKLGIRLPAVER